MDPSNTRVEIFRRSDLTPEKLAALFTLADVDLDDEVRITVERITAPDITLRAKPSPHTQRPVRDTKKSRKKGTPRRFKRLGTRATWANLIRETMERNDIKSQEALARILDVKRSSLTGIMSTASKEGIAPNNGVICAFVQKILVEKKLQGPKRLRLLRIFQRVATRLGHFPTHGAAPESGVHGQPSLAVAS